jgi:hypothetical protein
MRCGMITLISGNAASGICTIRMPFAAFCVC